VFYWNYAAGIKAREKLSSDFLSYPWDTCQHSIMNLCLLDLFLKDIHFNNPTEKQKILDERRKFEAEDDIVNFWNFPEGLGLKMKARKFSPYVPRGQLTLSEL
jgi:hypothetical protein